MVKGTTQQRQSRAARQAWGPPAHTQRHGGMRCGPREGLGYIGEGTADAAVVWTACDQNASVPGEQGGLHCQHAHTPQRHAPPHTCCCVRMCVDGADATRKSQPACDTEHSAQLGPHPFISDSHSCLRSVVLHYNHAEQPVCVLISRLTRSCVEGPRPATNMVSSLGGACTGGGPGRGSLWGWGNNTHQSSDGSDLREEGRQGRYRAHV